MPTYPSHVTDVVSEAQLATTIAQLSPFGLLAVDLEADSMHAFRASLCFVQIASDDGIFLVDTLVPEVKVDRLSGLFSDPARTKVFHAAGGDLTFLADHGIRVQ